MIVWAILVVAVLLAAAYWLYMSSYSQVFGAFPYKGSTTEKHIALTFDDGPNEPHTSRLLEYLNSENIKASFFQVGSCVARYPEVTKKIERSGHLIGNHSLSHAFHKYVTEHDFENEITQSQAIFKRVLGKTPVCFRPPWLMHYPKLFKTIDAHKLHVVSGEFCHAFEVFQPSAARIARRAVAKAKPGAILIFHDGVEAKGGNRNQTVDAIPLVVKELRSRGYTFVTVDTLLGIKTPYRS